MRLIKSLPLIVLLICLADSSLDAAEKPNIVVILADVVVVCLGRILDEECQHHSR